MVQLDTTPTRSQRKLPKCPIFCGEFLRPCGAEKHDSDNKLILHIPEKKEKKNTRKKKRCPGKKPGEYREEVEVQLLKLKLRTRIA